MTKRLMDNLQLVLIAFLELDKRLFLLINLLHFAFLIIFVFKFF